jgi:hypothetical protein
MSTTMRVFVNGAGYDVPAGGTAYDAVALHDADEARALREGGVLVTDSRGLPIDPDAPMFNGAVLRLIPNRGRDAADPAARFDE